MGAGIGVIFSLTRLTHRLSAEKHYVDLLRDRHDQLKLLLDKVTADDVIDHEEWHQLQRALVEVLDDKKLSDSERQLILESLRQSSAIGRQRYTAKLLQRVGLGERLAA